MKVLFAALKYDYGRPKNGLSVEYTNFFDTVSNMPGVEAEFFAVDEHTIAIGKKAMGELLIKKIKQDDPDLLFCYLLNDELEKETIFYITNKTRTKTFNWFADDHWRVPVYSRYWAPLFTMVSTTDADAPYLYKKYGINNVFKTQWGANIHLYKPQEFKTANVEKRNIQISFVGKKYGNREKYINSLISNGLSAGAFGTGWSNGRVSFDDMLSIFSQSKINLNFSETYLTGLGSKFKLLAKLFFQKTKSGYEFTGRHFSDNLLSAKGVMKKPIKGRVFEVPACGGFLLTGLSDDDIGEYYLPDKEIVVFNNLPDLVEKCNYYLKHESERVAIAKAGYERTLRDHTYERRFKDIFKALEII